MILVYGPIRLAQDTRYGVGMTKYFERCHRLLWFCTKILNFICEVEVQAMSTPENPTVNFFSLFRRGQHYAKTWPMEKRLAPMFIENRTIRATRYAIRFMPPVAIFTLCWQIALGGQLGPAVATALFALSLPMQGLWWLGKRSITPLPPSILHWFYEVRGKLEEAGQALAPVEGKPDYQALADTLKRAFKQLDKTFLDDL